MMRPGKDQPSASPIYSKSVRCSLLFQRLSKLLDDDLSLHTISSTSCLDEFSRFRIWANNIGALLSPSQRNSLEYRLRNAPRVSDQVVDILEDLEEALGDGILSQSQWGTV